METGTMTTREAIYRFVIEYKIANDGNTPTHRQIMDGCGISSTSIVAYHLGILDAEGLIKISNRQITVIGAQWLPPDNYQKEG